MTDRDLEQQLRAWYVSERGADTPAPSELRRRVLAIPATIPGEARTFAGRRGLTLLVAATLLIGGAVAAGTGLVHLPTVLPRVSPAPSEGVIPSPTVGPPPPSPVPQEPPQGGPAQPVSREVLDANQGFLLAKDHVGWAATNTALYRTLDGGETWTDVRPAGWTASARTQLVDADTAYLASDSMPMMVAATHDGGTSWVTATIDDRHVDGGPEFAFQTPTKGFATFFDRRGESRLRVYATTDGGRTWTGPRLGRVPTIEASLGKFRDPSGGVYYLVSGKYDYRPFNNEFVLSFDGGATWKTRTFPIGGPSPAAVQKSISRIWLEPDGGITIAINADERWSLWRSNDAGVTWDLVKALPRDVEVSGADFISRTEWVFSLYDGSGFRSTVDAGAHWRTTKTVGGVRIDVWNKTFASADEGWAVYPCRYGHQAFCPSYADASVLLATTDGGRTWSPLGEVAPPAVSPPPVPGEPAWVSAGTIPAGQYGVGPGVTAVELRDGRVLVVGGQDGRTALYDPASGVWTKAASQLHDRYGQVVALLPDGRVLAAGGSYDNGNHSTTEIYDPTTDRWTWAPPMHIRRAGFSAVTLHDGRVLVVGAQDGEAVTAEIFDPASARWSMTGRPADLPYGATPLVVLQDGRVLRAGGDDGENHPSAAAQLYDPATGAWTAVAHMVEPRSGASAILLADGRVLIAGGARSFAGRELPKVEIFDPSTGRWSATGSMATTHGAGTATLLADGRVLIAGGMASTGAFVAMTSTEIYDPATGIWSSTAALSTGRYDQVALSLPDGSVLIVAGHGRGSFNRLGSAERFYLNGPPAS